MRWERSWCFGGGHSYKEKENGRLDTILGDVFLSILMKKGRLLTTNTSSLSEITRYNVELLSLQEPACYSSMENIRRNRCEPFFFFHDGHQAGMETVKR
jgi:hypothetical protein